MLICLTRIKRFTSIYFCDVTSFHLGQKASLHSAPALASTQAPWTLAYHLLRWQADCYVDDGHLLVPPGLSNANLLAMMSAIDDEDGVIGSVQEEQAVRIQSAFRSKRAKARLGREKDAKLKRITAAAEAHAELKSLLKKTYNSVGADRASERAVDAMKILSELHIQTPEQLKQALDEPDLVRELQSRVLRGLLLPAAPSCASTTCARSGTCAAKRLSSQSSCRQSGWCASYRSAASISVRCRQSTRSRRRSVRAC